MDEGRRSLYYANSSSIFQLSFHIDIPTIHDFEQLQEGLLLSWDSITTKLVKGKRRP